VQTSPCYLRDRQELTLPGTGRTNALGNVTFANLTPGTYTYRVDASGYASVENNATVVAGQNQTSAVTLQIVNTAGGSPVVFYYVLGGIIGLAIVLYALRRKIWKKKRGTWGEEDYFQGR
jgi:carboxypeptidase family protein